MRGVACTVIDDRPSAAARRRRRRGCSRRTSRRTSRGRCSISPSAASISTTTGSPRSGRVRGRRRVSTDRHARSGARAPARGRAAAKRAHCAAADGPGWTLDAARAAHPRAWAPSLERCSPRRTATSSRRSSRPRLARRQNAAARRFQRAHGSAVSPRAGCPSRRYERRRDRGVRPLCSPPERGRTRSSGRVRMPPLRPVRGQLLHLGWTGHPLNHNRLGTGVLHRPPHRRNVARRRDSGGRRVRRARTTAGVRDLLDAASELLPSAWDATFLAARAGLRPATPDELPVIGPDTRLPGLVHASGHYRNGVLLAPLTARLVADWILDRKTRPGAGCVLRPGRFEARSSEFDLPVIDRRGPVVTPPPTHTASPPVGATFCRVPLTRSQEPSERCGTRSARAGSRAGPAARRCARRRGHAEPGSR